MAPYGLFLRGKKGWVRIDSVARGDEESPYWIAGEFAFTAQRQARGP
jgi:hypothetical protein